MNRSKGGASSLIIKNQAQKSQYGNKLIYVNVPNINGNNGKNINIYNKLFIFKNARRTQNYLPLFPRSSSKVLGDSYLTNRTPFNKQYRYDYKYFVSLYGR